MADFKVEVPINAKGGTGSGSSGGNDKMVKELEKMNKNTKDLNKTMFMNIDVLELASMLIGDLAKMFQPLIKILSLLLMMFFLPVLPVLKFLVKILAKVVRFMPTFWKMVIDGLTKFIMDIGAAFMGLVGLLINIGAIFFKAGVWIGEMAVKIGEAIANGALWIWEKLVAFGDMIGNGITWIWDTLVGFGESIATWATNIWAWFVTGFENVANFGKDVWQIFKDGLSSIADLGARIWGWISNALGNIRSLFGGGKSKKVDDAIITPGGKIITTNPKDYLIATKNPGSLGGATININNPVVRNDQDIKKIANEVSRVLQRQMPGRFSS